MLKFIQRKQTEEVGMGTKQITVTIHTAEGQSYEVTACAGDAHYYDELPFRSSNVITTEVKDSSKRR